MFGDSENIFGPILDHLDTFEAFLRKKILPFFRLFSSIFMPKNEGFHRKLNFRDIKKSIFQKVGRILKIHLVTGASGPPKGASRTLYFYNVLIY